MKIPHCSINELARDLWHFCLCCAAAVGLVVVALVCLSPVFGLFGCGRTRLDVLCEVEVPGIAFALRAHSDKKGAMPGQLDALVGRELSTHPVPPWEGSEWGYQRVGTGARLFTRSPTGPVEAWIYASGRTVVTGCGHGWHG